MSEARQTAMVAGRAESLRAAVVPTGLIRGAAVATFVHSIYAVPTPPFGESGRGVPLRSHPGRAHRTYMGGGGGDVRPQQMRIGTFP